MRSRSDFPKLKGKAVLSPMAGVTDVAFRALCKRYGAALTYTEFVSGTALVKGNVHAKQMVQTDPVEQPVAVQLFGNRIEDIISAARMLSDRFDIIDVNCGCPAWKVIRSGAGSEMLKSPDQISRFVNKLVSAIDRPVTVKIRTGIDEKSINAVSVAKIIEDAGASAIAIHGRTQSQGYSGQADWDLIKQVKEAVNIPVIGNGDVFTPEVFRQRLMESGVDYIMMARGAIGNPHIFAQINDYLDKGSYSTDDRLRHFSEYLELALKYKISFPGIQTHAMNFTKGIVGGARLREDISKCKSVDELNATLNQQKNSQK